MQAYLRMHRGPQPGAVFSLEAPGENRIGRGLDCQITLTDPLSSRTHAIIQHAEGMWWLRDAGSRNGTYVNGQKVDDAQLISGDRVRIGSAEFSFYQEADTEGDSVALTQTIVLDRPVTGDDGGEFGIEALRDTERAEDFLLLYQLSIRLLGCEDPNDVVRVTLELLQERLQATVVGFLWLNDEGMLRPKLVLPEDQASKVRLSKTLTDVVCQQKRAIWVANQALAGRTATLSHYADAICVPLIRDKGTVGAIHLYQDQGRFRESDLEMAVSVANILVVGLMRALRQASLRADHQRLVSKNAVFDELIGDSQVMQDLKGKVERIGRASGCVLIRGESGVGKELVARALHRASPRADRPMLSVNCAAIPRDLMESQLFGHKKGAFTGADADHGGWFQQADSGTLFLDEVGELTLEGQAKLLRILEGHPFLPVGGTKEVQVDVRVIAATNRDLGQFVQERQFRDDLFYRLTVFELEIPPLRERGGDVAQLLDFFLDHFRKQHGRPDLQFSQAARMKLLAYRWPGNVRQLRNVIDSAVVMAAGTEIEAEDLGLRDVGGGSEFESLRIDFWEERLIREALDRTNGNIPAAAQLLGIGRATLYRKVEQYNLKR